MRRNTDLLITAIAPVIWRSTYLVTTEYLPAGYPLTVAMLGTPVRALSVIAALAGLSGIAFLILTPQTALDQGLGSWQLLGVCIVFMSVWLSQYASKKTAPLSPAQVAPEPGLSRVY